MNILLFANIGTSIDGFYHIGDEAMFLETYRWYQKHHPKDTITIFSSLPNHQNLKLVELTNEIDLSKTNKKYLLKILVKNFLYKYFNINLLTSIEIDLTNIIKKQDRIHFCGGGNLTSLFQNWLYYSLIIISVAKIYKKEIILTSQTIGPFNLVDKIITSILLFGTKNVTRGNQMLDAAYSLSVTSNFKLPPKKYLRIGLSLHDWKNSTNFNLELLKTLTVLNTKQKIEIVLIPHVLNCYINDCDMGYMQKLFANSNLSIVKPNIKDILNSKPNASNTIKKLTASCDLLITTRYHGIIFALSCNVPVLTYVSDNYYSDKNIKALKIYYKNDYYKYLNEPKNIMSIINNLSIEQNKLKLINDKLSKNYDLFHNNLEHKIID